MSPRLVALATAALLSLGTVTSALAGPRGREPAAADPSKALIGKYKCVLKDGDVAYKAQPCRIKATKANRASKDAPLQLVFEKSGGSQRFTGSATPTDGGFAFSGKFFCPRGACDQQLEAVAFTGDAKGGFSGTLPLEHGPVQVTVQPLRRK
jgi:hypothetical protein